MRCRGSARRFGVSFSSAIRWVAALHERGSYAPLRMGCDTRSQLIEAHADFCLALIGASRPYAQRNCDRLSRARGQTLSPSMIWGFFDRHDITFYKNRSRERAVPLGVLERLRRWFDGQLDLDPLKLVFVDETAATTKIRASTQPLLVEWPFSR